MNNPFVPESKRFQIILKLLRDSHFKDLLKGGSTAFFVKIISILLSFYLNIFLAQKLGASGMGYYFLCFSFISVSVMLGRFGTDKAQLRFVSQNATLGKWNKVLDYYIIGVLMCLIFSVCVTVLFFIFTQNFLIFFYDDPKLSEYLNIFGFTIIPLALIWNHVEVFKATKQILISTSLQGILLTGFLILLMIVGQVHSVKDVLIYYTYTSYAVLLISIIIWKIQLTKKVIFKFSCSSYETRMFIRSSYSLFWVSLATQAILWSPTLILGLWESEEVIGKFSVANKIASLIIFFQLAVNTILAPKISESLNSDKGEDITTLIQKALGLTFVVSLPVFISLFLFPEIVLEFFGEEFTTSGLILKLLLVGYLLEVFCSPQTLSMMMSGNEKIFRNIMVLIAIVLVVMNIILIPNYGGVGAALGFLFTTIIKFIAVNYFSNKTLLINIFRIK